MCLEQYCILFCIFYIRLVCTVTPEGVGSFEGVLFPIFQIILQQDILGMMRQFCYFIVYPNIGFIKIYRIYAIYVPIVGSAT
jgi:hypothetical protein